MNTTTHRVARSLTHGEKVQLSADYARLLTQVRLEATFAAQLDGDLVEVMAS